MVPAVRGRVGGETPAGEYARHRRAVLGMLAKRFPRLDEDDRLAIYHDAWARVLVKRQHGEDIHSLRAFLLATAGAEALNAVTRRKPPSPVGPDDPLLTALADDGATVEEQVVTRDEARIARNLLDSLDERQRDVLKLRWDLQLSGAEVRAALGLSDRQYQRLTEEGIAAIADRVEQFRNGSWSRRQRSLLAACLVRVAQDGDRRVGIASAKQRKEAQRLVESDPHVAALLVEVRAALRGGAPLLPMPALLVDGDALATSRFVDVALQARTYLADLTQAAKQHATSLYIRSVDPALLATPRPGTAVATIAAGLVLTGGAYTAHRQLSPSAPVAQKTAAADRPPASPRTPVLRPVAIEPPKPLDRRRDVRPSSAPATTPEPPIRPQTPQLTSKPQPTPTPSDPIPTTPTPQPTEFGFED
jgi:DNA-directed RNA polymerase specialized sigma24 family protein